MKETFHQICLIWDNFPGDLQTGPPRAFGGPRAKLPYRRPCLQIQWLQAVAIISIGCNIGYYLRVLSLFLQESVVDELVMKVRSLERELTMNKSDIEVSSEGATREIGHLKNQISEFNELLKSKTQTIDMFQKEIDEKDAIQNELRQKLASLQRTVCANENQLQSLDQKCKQIEKERDEYKEKYETESSEKGMVKEQLDKVGSELSQQLDQETQKVVDLMVCCRIIFIGSLLLINLVAILQKSLDRA